MEYFENTTDISNDTNILRHSVEWSFTLVAAYALIFVFGLVGNSAVILVFIRRPQIRNVTNTFITNLAVSDLFVSVFCVPATLLANVFIPWLLGSFLCKWVAYVQGVSVCLSAYSLVAISFDRCKAICRPMERANGLSKLESYQLIFVIWIVSLVLNIPSAYVFDTILSEEMDGIPFCVEIWQTEIHGKIYFLIVQLISFYLLPFLLMFLMYLKIWICVGKRQTVQSTSSSSSSANTTVQEVHRKTKYSVLKMILIITLTFLLCWLPLFCVATIVKFSLYLSKIEIIVSIYLPISQLLGFSNSGINPILYAFLNPKFRTHFMSLVRNRAVPLSRQATMQARSIYRKETLRRKETLDSASSPKGNNNSGKVFPLSRVLSREGNSGGNESPKISFIQLKPTAINRT